MKILLDTGVVSSANILVGDSRIQELRWGSSVDQIPIAGFRRIDPVRDADQQREKDALFTIGRLAREGRISLHSYSELVAEIWRGSKGRNPILNAFSECKIQQCPAALERSKFRSTTNMKEWFSKGGKADRKGGKPASKFSQISFFKWLLRLPDEVIGKLVSHSDLLGLDDFEVLSLHDIAWFRTLAHALGSPEHLPDCFHLWTARRNGIDVVLTLEKALPRTIEQLKRRKQHGINLGLHVLRPMQLLRHLEVTRVDNVPLEIGRFYSYMEIFQLRDQMLNGLLSSTELDSPLGPG